MNERPHYKTRRKATIRTSDLYAPIDHRVIDSPAFADLSGETIRVLLVIARQWTPSTNGKLQATYSYAKRHGLGSNNTLNKALSELISHGFIFRTRSHGIDSRTGKNQPALYAITWRSIELKERPQGMFIEGFVYKAFERWTPKTGGQ